MRVRLTGNAEFIRTLEDAAAGMPGVTVNGPPTRRESAELQWGLKETLDLLVAAKDVAELASMLWTGAEWLRHHRENKQPRQKVEVSTTGERVTVVISAETTREEIDDQLEPLRPRPQP